MRLHFAFFSLWLKLQEDDLPIFRLIFSLLSFFWGVFYHYFSAWQASPRQKFSQVVKKGFDMEEIVPSEWYGIA